MVNDGNQRHASPVVGSRASVVQLVISCAHAVTQQVVGAHLAAALLPRVEVGPSDLEPPCPQARRCPLGPEVGVRADPPPGGTGETGSSVVGVVAAGELGRKPPVAAYVVGVAEVEAPAFFLAELLFEPPLEVGVGAGSAVGPVATSEATSPRRARIALPRRAQPEQGSVASSPAREPKAGVSLASRFRMPGALKSGQRTLGETLCSSGNDPALRGAV